MASKAAFHWADPLLLDQQLTDDERAVRDAAASLLPGAPGAARAGGIPHTRRTDPAIFREMGELGLLGATIPEQYGGAGLNYVCYGLIAREVERVDSGYRSMMSVQSSLVMVPIFEFGNEATEAEVPAQAGHRRVDRLLRPDRAEPRLRPRQHGHAGAQGRRRLQAHRAARCGSPTAPIADVFVVWAKDDEGAIRGFVLEKGWKGLTRPGHPRQGRPARLDHRRDRDGRGVLPRGERLSRGARPEGPVHLPELGALRHRLGRAGRGRGLLAPRAPVRAGSQAVRQAAGGQPADPEEAGRHADRDHAGPAGLPAPGPHEGRGHGRRWRSPRS